MAKVEGEFKVTQTQEKDSYFDEPKQNVEKKRKTDKIQNMLLLIAYGFKSFVTMTKEFILYSWESCFGLCIFMKACGTLTWGASKYCRIVSFFITAIHTSFVCVLTSVGFSSI
jgi:hypothetical protein